MQADIPLAHTAWLERAAEQAPYRKQCVSSAQSGDPVRVLIIDGDAGGSARLVAQVHAVGSFETRTACSARSALTVADDFAPNIVLLNTNFPDLASYHLATALRWHSGLTRIRLIALTSDIPAADRRRALEAGFERYLTIPVQHAALESVLRSLPSNGNDLQRGRANRRRH
jgi:adenylate cyclase